MLNENLAKVRKERGLTQEALAGKLHVVRQTISKWEKGTAVPDADTLCRIAEALEVSVSALLGVPEQGDRADAPAETLAKIKEQLAARNRRAAAVWKALFLISLVVNGILVGRICFGSGGSGSASGPALPEKIEVSSVSFQCGGEELVCTFVPSVGKEDITYSVTISGYDSSFPGVTAVSEYENGLCRAVFDAGELSEYGEYRVVLCAEYQGDVRNVTIADVFDFQDNVCRWEKWES